MNKIGKSLHVNWEDLTCKDGTPYPTQFILDGRIIELIVMFERIRAIWEMPIEIISAYRTPTHNTAVGGAKNSMHLHGKALDLRPPKGVSLGSFYTAIKKRALNFGIRGLGKYSTFVHVDIRPSDKLITW